MSNLKEFLRITAVGLLLFLPFIIILGGSYLFSYPFGLVSNIGSYNRHFSPITLMLGAVYVPWLIFCFFILLREEEKNE